MGRNPMTHNFFGIQDWREPVKKIDITFNEKIVTLDENVTILRSILFFHSEQKVKLCDIQKYFTTEAINKLVNDKFIKIKING